jgi:hypothetical protein
MASKVWATTAMCSPGAVVAVMRQKNFMKTIDAHQELRFNVRPTLRYIYVRNVL